MVTPYVKYHKLTKVANQYCSHYDNTSENCAPLRLEENARKHTANQRWTTFLHLLLRLSPLIVEFQHGYKRCAFISFSTTLLIWKRLNDIEEVKTCLNHYSNMHMHKQRKKDTWQSNSFCTIHLSNPIFKIFDFSFGCCFDSCLVGKPTR